MAANLPSNTPENSFSTHASTIGKRRLASPTLHSLNQTMGDTVAFQRKPKLPSNDKQLIMESPIGRFLNYAYSILQKPWSVFGHPLTGLNSTVRFIGPTIYNRTPFLKGIVEKYTSELPQDSYVPIANHELGHALISASGNVEMDGLYLHKILNTDGGVQLDRSVQKLAEADPRIAAKHLVMLLGGYAAELNRSTAEELADPVHHNLMLSGAYKDFAESAELLKSKHLGQALNLKPEEIPDLNFARFLKIDSEIAAAQNLPAAQREIVMSKLVPQATEEFKAIEQFLALPVIRDGVGTAKAMHQVISADKRERLIQEVAEKKFYDKSALYELLDRHVTEEEGRTMVQHLERFILKHLHF